MRVLVACEFSGVVRRAFRARGHEAYSCDLLPADDGGEHIQGDVRKILKDGWDMMIAHPPCTHLAVSGARWFKEKVEEQQQALDFVARLLAAPIPRIALENPVSVISSWIRPPDQVLQPWQFGHGEVKATCLWLKGLPKLEPTKVVEGRHPACWLQPPSPDRWKLRSMTYAGIADRRSTPRCSTSSATLPDGRCKRAGRRSSRTAAWARRRCSSNGRGTFPATS
jgi:hypothetical protein